MTHAEAFLRNIIAHPDDDAPRLIFADWLEEQGDVESVARAEFIRVQCALVVGQLSPQQRAKLQLREQQILSEWGECWARMISWFVQSWIFRRGFIDEVVMEDGQFLQRAELLFRHHPVQQLHLRPHRAYYPLFRHAGMAWLADNEHLRWLRMLGLSDSRLGSEEVRALLVSEHLMNLTALDLSHNRIGDGGCRALATSPLLGRLKRLDLRFNDVGGGGLRALAHALEERERSPEGLRLQRLELASDNLSAAAQRVIAETPLLRRLVL